MCTPPYSLFPNRTDTFSPSSRNIFILADFNCHYPLWNSRGTSNPHREEVVNWVISSDLRPFNDPDTPILLHHPSPDISFAPSSLALSCSCEMLQDKGSDHLPIFLSVPLSPVFHSNEHPPILQFSESSLR